MSLQLGEGGGGGGGGQFLSFYHKTTKRPN